MKKLLLIFFALMPILSFGQATGKIISNKPTGGTIGLDTITVYSKLNLEQTTAGQTISIATWTTPSQTKTLYIRNTGEVNVTVQTLTSPAITAIIPPYRGILLDWVGGFWNIIGKYAGGEFLPLAGGTMSGNIDMDGNALVGSDIYILVDNDYDKSWSEYTQTYYATGFGGHQIYIDNTSISIDIAGSGNDIALNSNGGGISLSANEEITITANESVLVSSSLVDGEVNVLANEVNIGDPLTDNIDLISGQTLRYSTQAGDPTLETVFDGSDYDLNINSSQVGTTTEVMINGNLRVEPYGTSAINMHLYGTAGLGYLSMARQTSTPAFFGQGQFWIDNDYDFVWHRSLDNFNRKFSGTLTADRTYTMPDASGTLVLYSDLDYYLPLAGGTMSGTLDMGSSGIDADHINDMVGQKMIQMQNGTDVNDSYINAYVNSASVDLTLAGSTTNNNFVLKSKGTGHVAANDFRFVPFTGQGAIMSAANTADRTYTFQDASGTVAFLSDITAGSGTVTDVSVVTANGISGSVATSTTTPAITLSLGAITPTTVNGNTITTGTGTLTLAAGKTLTASNSLTLAGTDATVMTFPATSNTIAGLGTAQTFTQKQTFTASTTEATALTLLDGTYKGALEVAAANSMRIGSGFTTLRIPSLLSSNGGSNSLSITCTTLSLISNGGILASQSYTGGATGTIVHHSITGSFTKANITGALYVGYNAVPTINQSGSSTGAIAMFEANPTVTSVTDVISGFRSRIAASPTGGGTAWNIYADGTANNAFAGRSYFGGTTAPTANIHLAASTTAASTASLKINEGSRQTAAEDGTINYVANNLEFVETSTVYTLAKTLTNTATLDFGSTAAGASTDLTITVTGAADGDAVSVGVPNASTLAAGDFTTWVSAANTVTVRFSNNSAGALDPASGTFRVSVIKY